MIIKINKKNKPKRKQKPIIEKSKKTIIFVWGVSNYGIGDHIRGTITLFCLCKKLNFNLIVDTQFHTISNFLVKQNHKYSDLVLKNKKHIKFVPPSCVEKYIRNSNKSIIYLFTNSCCNKKLMNGCKSFMKKILTPNKNFKEYINKKFSQIPYRNYNILHYRLGDRELVNNKSNKNQNNARLLKKLINRKENNDIFISDSNSFKNYVRYNTNIFMFETKPRHTGFEKNTNYIRDTIFELFLISRAKNIKTYSVYYQKFGWISGFVWWISGIYDIPLKIIR